MVDGTDNFPTRYLTNDACVLLKKPNVYGSIFRFEGQASVFAPHLGGPCYRCLYPEPPPPGVVPSCAEGGVLGVLPGIIGLIQATEILKLILGKGTSLLGRLLLFNALDMKFRELKLRRDPQCPLCGEHPTITELIDYETFCGAPPPSATTAMHPDEVTVQDMKRALDNPQLGIQVIDVREPDEYEIARINGVPLLPLSTLAQRFTELDPNQSYYLHCKAGVRSLKALQFLRAAGLQTPQERQGRHHRLVRRNRPHGAEILTRDAGQITRWRSWACGGRWSVASGGWWLLLVQSGEERDDFGRAFPRRDLSGGQFNSGVCRRLIRRAHAGEPPKLSRTGKMNRAMG